MVPASAERTFHSSFTWRNPRESHVQNARKTLESPLGLKAPATRSTAQSQRCIDIFSVYTTSLGIPLRNSPPSTSSPPTHHPLLLILPPPLHSSYPPTPLFLLLEPDLLLLRISMKTSHNQSTPPSPPSFLSLPNLLHFLCLNSQFLNSINTNFILLTIPHLY